MTTTETTGIVFGSLRDWYHSQQHNDNNHLALLDLQSHDEYQTHHIRGAIHIPLSEVRQRSYELPPRQDAFSVLVSAANDIEKEEALQLIREFFLFQDDNNNNINNTSHRRRRAQKPWIVPLVLVADNFLWQKAKELGILETASSNCEDVTRNNSSSDEPLLTIQPFEPLPRLWKPDPMIQNVLLPILKKRLRDCFTSAFTTMPQKNIDKVYEIWDLGAGAGRDVCFLAEELKATISTLGPSPEAKATIATTTTTTTTGSTPCPRKVQLCVVGMDQRYYKSQQPAPKSTHNSNNDNSIGTTTINEEEECVLFWQRRGVGDVTRCASVQWRNTNQNQEHLQWFQDQSSSSISFKRKKVSLIDATYYQEDDSNNNSNSTSLQENDILCIYLVRFWNQSLMEFLAESDVVETGTLIAVSQFAKPFAGASWNFDHPKEKNVLERDTLSKLFSYEFGWVVVFDEIVQDSDHGRTLVQFVAMKSS